LKASKQSKPLSVAFEFAELCEVCLLKNANDSVVLVRRKPTANGLLAGVAERRISNVVSQTSVADNLGNRVNKTSPIFRKTIVAFDKPLAEPRSKGATDD
jgi:hypothetical protein